MEQVISMWDGWVKKCEGQPRGPGGATDAWTFLLDKYGHDKVALSHLYEMVTPVIDYAVNIYTSMDRNVRFTSNNVAWGPEHYPLNVLMHLNDLAKWTPEDFRSLDLRYQHSLASAEEDVLYLEKAYSEPEEV